MTGTIKNVCSEHSRARRARDHMAESEPLCREATFGWVLKDGNFFHKLLYFEIILDSEEFVKIVPSSCAPFTQLPPTITSYTTNTGYQHQEADNGANTKNATLGLIWIS